MQSKRTCSPSPPKFVEILLVVKCGTGNNNATCKLKVTDMEKSMKMNAKTVEQFSQQLEAYLRQPESNKVKNIIYYLKVSNPIKKIMGDSDIVYIGKTSGTLQDRYLNSSSFKIELGLFENYYKGFMENYGDMNLKNTMIFA